MSELETAIRCTPLQRSSERLRAIRALLLGKAARDVAEIFQVSTRTLTRWVAAFNGRGIDGLIEQPRSGRPRKLSAAKTPVYRELVERPAQAGQTHWTARKFHGYLRQELGEEVGYSTVVRWLHERNFRLRVPRPWPDRQDEAQRQVFVEQLGGLALGRTHRPVVWRRDRLRGRSSAHGAAKSSRWK